MRAAPPIRTERVAETSGDLTATDFAIIAYRIRATEIRDKWDYSIPMPEVAGLLRQVEAGAVTMVTGRSGYQTVLYAKIAA